MKNKQVQNQTALVPYVFDTRPAKKRGALVSHAPIYRVGQRAPVRAGATGGPANTGLSVSDKQANIPFYQSQPSWRFEFEDDFFGPAHKSTTPDLSGIPSNSFRTLGDMHGGRQ